MKNIDNKGFSFDFSKLSEDLFKGAKYIFVPVAALGGGVACLASGTYNTIADLFRHGDEIVIKKDTKFNILLLSKLEVPN